MNKLYVTKIWVDKGCLFAETDAGAIASYNLTRFRGFHNVSPSKLNDFVILGGKDVYWPELDEDINLEGMFYDNKLCKLTDTEDSVVYRPLPESNDCVAEPQPQIKDNDK